MADLSAFILAKNEADNVGPLMDSLAGIRDVVVLDNGSTDDTVSLFRARGARVYDGTQVGKHLVTAEDVKEFTERFGYAPQFKGGEVFDDSGARRNHAASLCRNDWVFNPDCDERVEWDLKKVKAMLTGDAPALRHRYIHKHNPDGTPQIEFVQTKIYNRQKGKYICRIHEVLVRKDTNAPAVTAPFCDFMILHHYQKEKAYRNNHADQLEYQALKDETVRNLHYLGREYIETGEFEKALIAYDRYFALDAGDFPEQRSQAWMSRAECFRELKRFDDAVNAYHEAMMLDDTRRDPFFFLGQLYLEAGDPKQALIWFTAANQVPHNPAGYLNDMRMYTWGVHDKLSICMAHLGLQEPAFRHWLEALKYLPDDADGARILMNGRYMVKRPQASAERASAECGVRSKKVQYAGRVYDHREKDFLMEAAC